MAHFAPRHVHKFNRFYGRGLGQGGVTRKLSFAQFAAMGAANEALDDPAYRFYVQAPLMWGGAFAPPAATAKAGAGAGVDAVAKAAASAKVAASATASASDEEGGDAPSVGVPQGLSSSGRLSHARVDSVLARDLAAMGWPWLDRALSVCESGGFHSCTLWAGHGGGCTPMHWDALSNFFTQLEGRKQILLFPPSQWPNVYPYPFDHPMETYAMVDVTQADSEESRQRFPALSRARGLEATLEPGDVLWLPSFWFHHVRQLDEGRPNLSLNCWCGMEPNRIELGRSLIVSTVLGGRARDMGAVGRAVPEPSIDALLACAEASYAAAKAAAASPIAAEALEAEDERLIASPEACGLLTLFLVQSLETKAAKGLGHAAAAAPFLNALAAGMDSQTNLPRPPGRSRPDPLLGAYGSEKHALAMELRYSLCSSLGPGLACAVLRAATRHGRLHPGPPKVGTEAEVTNSELKQVTRPEDVPPEVARLLASVDVEP
jgi:hypothetical protein